MLRRFQKDVACPWLILAVIIFRAVSSFSTLRMSSNNTPVTFGKSSPCIQTPKADRLFASHWDKSKLQRSHTMALTYLEINGWIVTSEGVTLLIDPILEGSLDFGIPTLYKASKRVMDSQGLLQKLPPIDGVLITQGLDDHAHARTLRQMSLLKTFQTVPIIAPPSALGTLRNSGFSGKNVKCIAHGEEVFIFSNNSPSGNGVRGAIEVRATRGALVGPPWQARENGYIISGKKQDAEASSSRSPSLYIEPHVEFSQEELNNLAPVDIVITPVVGQSIKPGYELVHGPTDSLRLIETLRPNFVLPMNNGDVQQEGPACALVFEVGSIAEFGQRLGRQPWAENIELIQVTPGQDIEITL